MNPDKINIFYSLRYICLSEKPVLSRFLIRKNLFKFLLRILILSLFYTIAFQNPIFAQNKIDKLYNKAYGLFSQEKYEEAIPLFRQYLKRRPSDFNTMTLLAASYYHAGLPKKCYKIIKTLQRRGRLNSYAYFYKGLALKLMGAIDNAEKAFKETMLFQDDYYNYALFELAILEYNKKAYRKADRLLRQYLYYFPSGPFAYNAQLLVNSIISGEYYEYVEGTGSPDLEKALYRFHPYSWFNAPHFWLMNIGSSYIERAENQPEIDPVKGISNQKTVESIDQSLNLTFAFGLGPYDLQGNRLTGGYVYKQLWHTDPDRLNTWLDDPSDFEYFAFRPDLLERRHELFLDFRRNMGKVLYFGLYSRFQYARIGSSMLSLNENRDLDQSLKIRDVSLFIPWVGISLNANLRILSYLYMRKEINSDAPDFSNRTYDFDESPPISSFGSSITWEIPAIDLETLLEVFQYDFFYNDIFLDYRRQGYLAGLKLGLPWSFATEITYGQYTDFFVAERLKQSGCRSNGQILSNDQDPSKCRRIDDGNLLSGKLYWEYSQNHRIELKYTTVENKNQFLSQFDESHNEIVLTATMAFPSVSRITRHIDRFSDAAFTRQN